MELYSVDGLEMAGHLVVSLGKVCRVTIDSYHDLEMYVSVCNLTKYLYHRGHIYDFTENGFERKKII